MELKREKSFLKDTPVTKPEDSPYICWVDLECTGNRPEDQIIEIGAVMTDRDLNELSAKQIVVKALLSTEKVLEIDPFVLEMHTKNGLWIDCALSEVLAPDADAQMVEWIKQYTKGDHIPLAGSGVSHYDRDYIEKDLPKFNRYLSYWAYDTGVIRRTLKLFGIDASFADTTDDKTHRALDDIKAHVEEMRRYKQLFTAMLSGPASVRSAGWPG